MTAILKKRKEVRIIDNILDLLVDDLERDKK